jgi:hypothetical protein
MTALTYVYPFPREDLNLRPIIPNAWQSAEQMLSPAGRLLLFNNIQLPPECSGRRGTEREAGDGAVLAAQSTIN